MAISQDEVAPGRLKEGPGTTTTTATVFLKLLVKGNQVNLYWYKDNLKERFYLLEKGSRAPVELGYQVYLVNTAIATTTRYKQQLAALAVQLKEYTLNQEIQKAGYNRAHLMKIVGKLNGTSDASISKNLEKAPRHRNFGSAGLHYATFIYKGENELLISKISDHGSYVFHDQVVTHSYLPRFSLGRDYYLNPAVQRFIIRLEAALAPAKTEVRNHYLHSNYSTSDPAHEQLNVYHLSLITVSAAPQVLMNVYNTQEVKGYLGAGGALNYHLVTQNKISYQRTDRGTTVSESKANDFYKIQKLGLGLTLRSGIILNQKFDFSVLYCLPTRLDFKSTNNHDVTSLGFQALQLNAGYFF